jgi:DNA helicase-2/ATP-dependent DNA helicase PcrA
LYWSPIPLRRDLQNTPFPDPSAQIAALTGTGIQLILAGPRSGKTRAITEKILHLIEKGIKPGNILSLTYSDKAAREMLERLERQTNTSVKLWVLDILRRDARLHNTHNTYTGLNIKIIFLSHNIF